MALEVINATLPRTIGGSADLNGSKLTRSKGMQAVRPDDYAGRYVHCGIREHGMAAVMNGIALHGGFIPYGGTFLAFADYFGRDPAGRADEGAGRPCDGPMTTSV